MEILLVLFLIVCNGLLSMAEAAFIASRKVRLAAAAERGDRGAKAALALSENPSHFLSTGQIGITMIGILSGAVGERALADDVAGLLAGIPGVGGNAGWMASVITVLVITYLSLVVGELVPKRLAMASPEKIAAALAAPMTILLAVVRPLAILLTKSTEGLLAVVGIKPRSTDAVTEEEVRGMIEQGAETGVFEKTEHKIVDRVFRLSDRVVGELMVPRTEIDWLPADATIERVRVAVATSPHSHFPVCRGGLDHLVGVVHVKDLVKSGLITDRIDLEELMAPPLYVPENMPALKALETFRENRSHIAFVLDEYGAMVGLITLNDLVESIVGEVVREGEGEDPMAVQRADGSWLLDGLLPVDALREIMDSEKLPKEEEAEYATLGGLVMAYLGRIPRAGDRFEWERFTFEVMDMDRQRVDKVLVEIRPEAAAPTGDEPGEPPV